MYSFLMLLSAVFFIKFDFDFWMMANILQILRLPKVIITSAHDIILKRLVINNLVSNLNSEQRLYGFINKGVTPDNSDGKLRS